MASRAKSSSAWIAGSLAAPEPLDQFGEDRVGSGVEAQPIGRIVPRGLGRDRLRRPAGKGGGEGVLGLRGPFRAAGGLAAAGEVLERLAVERAQQHRLPVVPDGGPDAADVADGEHGQELEPRRAFDRRREVADGARVGEVALLRNVGHQQVVLHQPFDEFGLVGVEAEPRADLAGDGGAEVGMVAA